MIKRNSLWGRIENNSTNPKVGRNIFLALSSNTRPIGTKNTDAAIPLGIAE